MTGVGGGCELAERTFLTGAGGSRVGGNSSGSQGGVLKAPPRRGWRLGELQGHRGPQRLEHKAERVRLVLEAVSPGPPLFCTGPGGASLSRGLALHPPFM